MGQDLQSYRYLCRVHEAQSEVVFLNDVQMVHDLVKQLLAFGFFLYRRTQMIRFPGHPTVSSCIKEVKNYTELTVEKEKITGFDCCVFMYFNLSTKILVYIFK